jgi:hypothetical protein
MHSCIQKDGQGTEQDPAVIMNGKLTDKLPQQPRDIVHNICIAYYNNIYYILHNNICFTKSTTVTIREVNCAKNEQDTQCTYDVIIRCVHESLLPWKRNKHYLLVSPFLCACMWVPDRVGVCMSISAGSLENRARNVYVPYCDVICGMCSAYFWELSHKRCDFRKKEVIEH